MQINRKLPQADDVHQLRREYVENFKIVMSQLDVKGQESLLKCEELSMMIQELM